MKGKMFIILAVLLVISYFLYEHGNRPRKAEDMPERYITGIVTDTKGNPIPKVTVYLLGADIKAGTDKTGAYKIKAVVGDELIFSHPMYKKRDITIKEREENIVMYGINEETLKDKVKDDFPDMEIQ